MEQGIFSEEDVFGKDWSRVSVFHHPELNSDFEAVIFNINHTYSYDINQTSVQPENFELAIWGGLSPISVSYNYENQQDADNDLTIFKQKMGIAE